MARKPPRRMFRDRSDSSPETRSVSDRPRRHEWLIGSPALLEALTGYPGEAV